MWMWIALACGASWLLSLTLVGVIMDVQIARLRQQIAWLREECARLRCTACGSAQLEVSEMGGKRQTTALDARREAQGQVEDSGSGSVVPG